MELSVYEPHVRSTRYGSDVKDGDWVVLRRGNGASCEKLMERLTLAYPHALFCLSDYHNYVSSSSYHVGGRRVAHENSYSRNPVLGPHKEAARAAEPRFAMGKKNVMLRGDEMVVEFDEPRYVTKEAAVMRVAGTVGAVRDTQTGEITYANSKNKVIGEDEALALLRSARNRQMEEARYVIVGFVPTRVIKHADLQRGDLRGIAYTVDSMADDFRLIADNTGRDDLVERLQKAEALIREALAVLNG